MHSHMHLYISKKKEKNTVQHVNVLAFRNMSVLLIWGLYVHTLYSVEKS